MQGQLIKYGTERCERLLKLLGNPDEKLKIIHIAGTNGKGSTAEYISSVLKCAGKRVGTFTSPQVLFYEEQFRIDCQPLSPEKIKGYLDGVKQIASAMGDKPTPFEVEAVGAVLAFYREGCEYAVLECGLGGRDDATNAISRKEVAVITSISLEHTAELGATLQEICTAKSGIIKNCPAVVSAYQCGEVKEFFKKFNPVFAGEGLTPATADTTCVQAFCYKGETYGINMLGSAQPYNAATAIEACRLLGIESRYITEGLKTAKLYGRTEVIKKGGRTFIFDGAHNPAAIGALTQTLADTPDFKGGEAELVFGCLSDKDVEACAKILAPHFKRAILFEPESARAMALDKMIKAFTGKIPVETAPSVIGALDKTESRKIVVCGSFTIIKEAREWIKREQ